MSVVGGTRAGSHFASGNASRLSFSGNQPPPLKVTPAPGGYRIARGNRFMHIRAEDILPLADQLVDALEGASDE